MPTLARRIVAALIVLGVAFGIAAGLAPAPALAQAGSQCTVGPDPEASGYQQPEPYAGSNDRPTVDCQTLNDLPGLMICFGIVAVIVTVLCISLSMDDKPPGYKPPPTQPYHPNYPRNR